MLKLKLLRVTVIMLIAMIIYIPAAWARLMAAGPETVISNSTLIMTGKVTKSIESEDERSFTFLVDRVLKGEYSEAKIEFTAKKSPVYGWLGNIRTVPEINTELLLFLRDDDNVNPYFTFDLNCIAIIEGQQVTSLLDASNVGINEEHWEIGDYLEAYNEFLHNAEPVIIQTESANAAENNRERGLSTPSSSPLEAVTASNFLPGIIAFLFLLAFLLAGLWYYRRSSQ